MRKSSSYSIQTKSLPFGTVEDVEYCGGIQSVMWRMLSIVEGYHQYCGRTPSVMWKDTISNVEDAQYCGRILSIVWRMLSTEYVISSALWR